MPQKTPKCSARAAATPATTLALALCVNSLGCQSSGGIATGPADENYGFLELNLDFRSGNETTAIVRDAQEHSREGQHEEAAVLFQRAIQKSPALVNAHVGLAQSKAELGDKKAARQHYNKAIRLDPRNFEAQMGHGRMSLEAGDLLDAERAFKAASDLDPDNPDVHRKNGIVLLKMERLQDALRAYLRALRLEPGSFEANRDLAAIYLQIREPDQALPYAQAAVNLQPNNGTALVNLGAVYAALGRHVEAVTAYRTAAEAMEPTPALLLNLAESLGKSRRHEEMRNTLDQLLRIEPSAQAYERRGIANFRLRSYTLAKQDFNNALSVDPKHFPALNGLAVCNLNFYEFSLQEDTRARDNAVRALRKSLRINRDQPKILDLLSRYQ